MTSRSPRLVLHVGAMKTGTSYVQNLIGHNRPALADDGWWVPEHASLVQAVRQLMALRDDPDPTLDRAPAWARMMERARREAGRGRSTLLSMEFLSHAGPESAARIMGGAAGLEPHVVLSVRDAIRAAPSQWQSLSRNGHTQSWPAFAAAVRTAVADPSSRGPGVRAFRRTQDIPRMLGVWGAVLPPERLTVVTVPGGRGTPPAELWHRFCTAVGVDPAITTTEATFDNPQLGYGSVELLRLINREGLAGVEPRAYRRAMRPLTAALLHLRTGQGRPLPDRATATACAELNVRSRAATSRHARLVGAVADLPDVVDDAGLDPRATADTPAPPGAAEVLAAAVVLHEAALALHEERGLQPPAGLAEPLPGDLAVAVPQVAALVAALMTGDRGHRTPSPLDATAR